MDIQCEHLLTLNEATRVLPPIDGKRPHLSTVWRWAVKGVAGVRLEHGRLGGRIVTSREALNRFAEAVAQRRVEQLNPPVPDTPAPASPRGRSAKERERAVQAARRQLDEAWGRKGKSHAKAR